MQASRGGESPWRRKGKIRTGRGEEGWRESSYKGAWRRWSRGQALPLLAQPGFFRGHRARCAKGGVWEKGDSTTRAELNRDREPAFLHWRNILLSTHSVWGPGDASTLHVAQARLTGAQSQLQLSPAPAPDVSDIGCVSPGVFPFPWLSPCFKLVTVTSGPSNCLLTGLLPFAVLGTASVTPLSTAETCCSNTRHGSLGPSDQNPNDLACICGPETSSPGFALSHPSLLLRLGSVFSLLPPERPSLAQLLCPPLPEPPCLPLPNRTSSCHQVAHGQGPDCDGF